MLGIVLDELRASDLSRRPFVIVECLVTKKFVQFARIVDNSRLPGRIVGEMVFDVPALGIVLESFDNNPTEGARRAVDVLEQWLPKEAMLRVVIDGDPEN